MDLEPLTREALRERVARFLDAFNRYDLDAVMQHFAEDALYETFDGQRHAGRAAIRAAFEPQFRGDYGRMTFVEEDVILDEVTGKAVVRWTCRHALDGARAAGLARVRQHLYRALYGQRLGWQGLDVLHFAGGQLTRKHTFARTRLPLVRSL